MGIDVKDILRGIGGAAGGVLSVRQQEAERQHDLNLLRTKERLHDFYQSRRDSAARKAAEKLESMRQQHDMQMTEYTQKLKDDVSIYGTIGIAKSVRDGLASGNIVAMQIASKQLDLAQKAASMQEFDENDVKALEMMPPDARVYLMNTNAKNREFGKKMAMEERQLSAIEQLNAAHARLYNAQADSLLRNPLGMTPEEIEAQKARIMQQMQEITNNDFYIQFTNQLSTLSPKDRAAYLDKKRAAGEKGIVDAYELAEARLGVLSNLWNMFDLHSPGGMEKYQKKQQEDNDDEYTPAPTSKKEGYSEYPKPMRGVMRGVEAQAIAEEGIAGKPLQKGMQGAIDLVGKSVQRTEDTREQNRMKAEIKRRGIKEKVYSYNEFTKLRKGKELKKGMLIFIKDRIYKLVGANKFEEY